MTPVKAVKGYEILISWSKDGCGLRNVAQWLRTVTEGLSSFNQGRFGQSSGSRYDKDAALLSNFVAADFNDQEIGMSHPCFNRCYPGSLYIL